MGRIVSSLLVTGLMSTAAMAQEAGTAGARAAAAEAAVTPAPGSEGAAPQGDVAPTPAAKRVTMTIGFDFVTAYVFRGIYQEGQGAIVPPYAEVSVDVGKGISVNVGNWSSLHSGPTGQGGYGNAWYESDYYGSVTFTAGKLKPGALFTSYTSPNGAFGTVHELAGVLEYDDSSRPFPLSPKVIVGIELHGQADGGASRGAYLELGIEPALQPASPLTVSIPVKVGLSLRDYYEGPTGSKRFGYFTTGVSAGVPLAFMSGKASWEAHGGVEVLWLGDNLKLLNSGNGFKPVGIIGMSVTF